MPMTYRTYSFSPETGSQYTWHENAFEGAVLAKWTETVRIMSDVWEDHVFALVWDAGLSQFRQMHLDDTAWNVPEPKQSVVVDATPELYAQYRAQRTAIAYESLVKCADARMEEERLKVHLGSVVVVKRGRKDVGKVGKVVFIKDMPYNAGWRSAMLPKACIALDGQKTTVQGKYGKTFDRYTNTIWVWVKNLDLGVTPEKVALTDEQKASLLEDATFSVEAELAAKGVKSETNVPHRGRYHRLSDFEDAISHGQMGKHKWAAAPGVEHKSGSGSYGFAA